MVTLSLGVNDIPYSWGQKKAGGISAAKAMAAAKNSTGTGGGMTTGDVAEILEARYGLMAAFLAMHEDGIRGEIENSLQGAMDSLMMGGPAGLGNALASATSQIEHLFKNALAMKEFDGRLPNVPTQAAQRGVSHRFKRPYARRPSRPSFIDTGLFQASFRVWTS